MLNLRVPALYLLLAVITLSTNGPAQTSDYTLQSAVEKVAVWSQEARSFNEYRKKKTWKDLEDLIVGSIIKINRFEIESGLIQVLGDKVVDAVQQKLVAKGVKVYYAYCLKPITNQTANSEGYYAGNRRNDDHFLFEFPTSKINGSFTSWDIGSDIFPRAGPPNVWVILRDTSDRLALEDVTFIDISGRIADVEISFSSNENNSDERPAIKFTIDMVSWAKSR